MKSLYRMAPRAVLAAALGLGLGPAGCGGKPAVDTGDAEATVSGRITFRGEPVTKGEVRFDPSNYRRKDEVARRAPIGADGRYTIKTLSGENRVTFEIAALKKSAELQDLALTYDAKAGENAYDIALPPTPPAP